MSRYPRSAPSTPRLWTPARPWPASYSSYRCYTPVSSVDPMSTSSNHHFHFSSPGSALECYVCSNQTDNTQKCLNTVQVCEAGEDVCLTEIRWGSQPYFSLGALKQYYVSKRCSTKKLCQRIRSKYMPYCTHIWYEDWSCSDCCQGDRCNYFVIVSYKNLSRLPH